MRKSMGPNRRRARTGMVTTLVAGGMFLAAVSGAVAADDSYYKGKTFTVMVGTKPGGGTDTVGRLVARFWGQHIPGHPDIIVRNQPMEVVGANYLDNKVHPDGLTVGVFAGAGSLGPVAQKLDSVHYDPLTWGYVGSVDRGPTIMLIRKSALARLHDPKAPPVAMGSVSTDRSQDAIAVFGGEYLGWNLKFVLGYPNSNAIYLAYERGEVDMFGSGTSEIIDRFIKEGAVPLTAELRRPDFPKVPTFVEMLGDKKPTGDKWNAYQTWGGSGDVDKYFAAPPKTPEDLLGILRASFKETSEDPAFKKAAHNVLGGGYTILSGPETRDLVVAGLSTTPGTLAEIKRLRAKYGLPEIHRKPSELVEVTFDAVERDGRVLKFKAHGKPMKLKVSGSRSHITIGGNMVERSRLKTGMTCEVSWAERHGDLEARKVVCP